jgi:hypothetical protein
MAESCRTPEEHFAVRPGICSHVWKDARYFRQLVHNLPVAPWDMQKGQVYRCVNCRWEIRP